MLAIALFISGAGVAPLIVAGYNVAEKSVPPEKVTETLSWVIAGSHLAERYLAHLTGHIIDSQGASKAFIVPITMSSSGQCSDPSHTFEPWRRISDH